MLLAAALLCAPIASGSDSLQVYPFGYAKYWLIDRADHTTGDLSMLRIGVRFVYRDWDAVYFYHFTAGEDQTLDAWIRWRPRDKNIALRQLIIGQTQTPIGWEARTSSSGIYTMSRTWVIGKLAPTIYDQGIWTEWAFFGDRPGYLGVGLWQGAYLNNSDPDHNKDLLVTLNYPTGRWRFEVARLLGHGWDGRHITAAMVQYSSPGLWASGEFWRGERLGTNHRGGYVLLRKPLGGRWYAIGRWERWGWSDASGRGHWDRTILGLSYECDNVWRAMVNWEITGGDNPPPNCLGFELQYRFYPWER